MECCQYHHWNGKNAVLHWYSAHHLNADWNFRLWVIWRQFFVAKFDMYLSEAPCYLSNVNEFIIIYQKCHNKQCWLMWWFSGVANDLLDEKESKKRKKEEKTVHLMTFIQSERVHFTFDGFWRVLRAFALLRQILKLL